MNKTLEKYIDSYESLVLLLTTPASIDELQEFLNIN